MTMESKSSKAQEASDTIIKQIHPIVAEFGFTTPVWDYDSESDIVRVQFENSEAGQRSSDRPSLPKRLLQRQLLPPGGRLANVYRRKASEVRHV